MKLSLFQTILIAVFALAALLGLYVFATYSGNSGQQQVGSIVIWGTFPQDQFQQALTAAIRSNPSLKGATYVEKEASTFESDLIASIAAGSAPDLAIMSQEDLVSLHKYLQPISSSLLSARTFQSSFVDGSTIYLDQSSGSAFAVPFLVDPLVLYYNKSILASSGIPAPPATWEALTGLVPHVDTFNSSGQLTRALIALGSYANVHNARAILSTLFLQSGVPMSSISQSGVLSANLGITSSGASAGQAVVRFYSQFADQSKVSYTWNPGFPDSQAAFINGDVAIYLGYASEASFIAQANPNLNFDVAPVPEPAQAPTKLTYGKIYAFAVPRTATNPAGSYAVALGIINAGESVAANATGLAPALRSAAGSPPNNSTAAVSYASALYTRGWLSPAPIDTDSVFSTMINSVNSGHLQLAQALSNAESALSAALQK